MIVSVSGFHLMVRPVSMAMTPRWPTLAERCATSPRDRHPRLRTQSTKF